MSTLRRKLIRDLKASRSTLASVIAIIAVGTGSFVGMGTTYRSLSESQSSYYRAYRFADFWVDVKKAPLSEVEAIRGWRGVDSVEGRVVFDVILDLPHQPRPLSGRLISVPPRDFDRTLNGLHIVRGGGFSDDRDEEVILSEAFAEANGLHVGDRVHAILNRKRQAFTVVGTAISPEYVYMVRGPGDLLPDAEHFGVMYIKQRYAREVLDFQDACNQVVGRAAPGVDVDALLDRIDRKLDPYGVIELVPRERNASHRFLSDEIAGQRVSSKIVPAIFLGIAALILNILMLRLAQRQRTTVGTLKAIGYGNRDLLAHFLGFAIVVGVLGGLGGALLGNGMAAMLTQVFVKFYQFPSLEYRFHLDLAAIGFGISIAFAIAGTVRGARSVLKLHPAEAMRPNPPERGGRVAIEAAGFLWRRLSFRSQMAIRSVMRNRFRTATAVFSTAIAIAIVFMSLVLWDSFYYMVEYQFDLVSRSDVDLGMRDEGSVRAVYEARGLPGVQRAEPMLGIACDLRNGRFSRRLGVTGLSPDHQLTIPRRSNGEAIPIPSRGLVLAKKLADLLHARVGDPLELTPVRGRRDTRIVHVASIVDTFLGLDAYADIDYLSEVVGEARAVNAVQLAVDPSQMPALYREIKDLPNAQGMGVRADAKHNIMTTLVENSVFSIGILIGFAGVIAFGSIVNNALIEIGDRVREVATLRVLGYDASAVSGIFFRQTAIIFLMGLTLSFPLGYAMVSGLSSAYDSELYRMPVVIRPVQVAYTVLASAAFVVFAQWVVERQVQRLDWQDALKAKE